MCVCVVECGSVVFRSLLASVCRCGVKVLFCGGQPALFAQYLFVLRTYLSSPTLPTPSLRCLSPCVSLLCLSSVSFPSFQVDFIDIIKCIPAEWDAEGRSAKRKWRESEIRGIGLDGKRTKA